MSNYTTQTATLKATTIDTRKIDAKQIDTKKLFINDKDINEIVEKLNKKIELSYKLTGNHHLLVMYHAGVPMAAFWSFDTNTNLTEQQIQIQNGKITVFNQHQYTIVVNSTQTVTQYQFSLQPMTQNCLLGSISFADGVATSKNIMLPATTDGENNTVINLYQEGDDLAEIYDGAFNGDDKYTILHIPFVYPSNNSEILDGEVTTTYSLRQTSTLLQKLIQKAQQNLDNSTE